MIFSRAGDLGMFMGRGEGLDEEGANEDWMWVKGRAKSGRRWGEEKEFKRLERTRLPPLPLTEPQEPRAPRDPAAGQDALQSIPGQWLEITDRPLAKFLPIVGFSTKTSSFN